jgi:hypothetical protein
MPSETRSYDLLGNLSESRQYSDFRFVSAFDMTMEPQSLLVTVNNHYTAAGLLDTQTSTHPTSPGANTDTKNLYDNHGILQSYNYTEGDGLGTAGHGFKNTYTYSYSFKAGALREGGVEVESNLSNSTTTHQRNTYDGRGNLVWQRSIDGPGNTEMVFFDYDGSGHVLDKAKIDLPPSRQAISDDKYDSFFYNSSGEAIGNVPSSSFAATSASLHANFGIGFTPVSPTYPSSQPSTYAIVAGDTLASIAKSFLGDAQLWYLIADANGLTAGPADSLDSEAGRSLRIPNVVANLRNNADTFSPYNPDTIIANTPWVGAPLPPPGPSDWEMAVQHLAPILGIATSMVLAVALSELGPLGAGIAAAAGAAASQSIQVGVGGKDPTDLAFWGNVGEAGLIGSVAGGLSTLGSAAAAASGGGLLTQALAQGGAAAATYAASSGIDEAVHGDAAAPFSGWSLLAAAAGGSATPVLGGFFSRLAQDAVNPKTGWVWHPNARAWDAFYQDLAIELGQVVIQDSFGSPRQTPPKPKRGSQPMPPAVLEDRAYEKGDLASQFTAQFAPQFEGSAEIVSIQTYLQTIPDDMQTPGPHNFVDASGRTEYQYVLDENGIMTSFTDAKGVTYQLIPEVIYIRSTPPAESSALAQSWSAVAAVDTIRDLQTQISEIERQIAVSAQEGVIVGGRTQAIRALQAKIQEIVDSHDPSIPRSSPLYTPLAPFIRLPYQTSVVPLQGPLESPYWDSRIGKSIPLDVREIAPDKGVRFGKYGGLEYEFDAVRSSVGDAYGYDVETDNFQVANDLERIARQPGLREIHIATGTHGTPEGPLGAAEFRFLREDARSILETMQRHPGLKIIPYNMADPIQAAQFNAMQALAADGKLPGGATIAANCFSRTRVPDPNEGPAGPYGSVEVLEGRGALGAAYIHGGLSVGFGAATVYGGLQDPNPVVAAVTVAGGGAQVIGGASYAIGFAMDSVPAVRFGAGASAVGGYVLIPIVAYHAWGDITSGDQTRELTGMLDMGSIAVPELGFLSLYMKIFVPPSAQALSETAHRATSRDMGEITGYSGASWFW